MFVRGDYRVHFAVVVETLLRKTLDIALELLDQGILNNAVKRNHLVASIRSYTITPMECINTHDKLIDPCLTLPHQHLELGNPALQVSLPAREANNLSLLDIDLLLLVSRQMSHLVELLEVFAEVMHERLVEVEELAQVLELAGLLAS
jgi:hypothetical protein